MQLTFDRGSQSLDSIKLVTTKDVFIFWTKTPEISWFSIFFAELIKSATFRCLKVPVTGRLVPVTICDWNPIEDCEREPVKRSFWSKAGESPLVSTGQFQREIPECPVGHHIASHVTDWCCAILQIPVIIVVHHNCPKSQWFRTKIHTFLSKTIVGKQGHKAKHTKGEQLQTFTRQVLQVICSHQWK